MDDVVIRPRYQRYRVPVKKRRKNYKNLLRLMEKIIIQLVVSALILLAVMAIKGIDFPAARYITGKVRSLLSENIDITRIYEQIDNIVTYFKPDNPAENGIKNVLPVNEGSDSIDQGYDAYDDTGEGYEAKEDSGMEYRVQDGSGGGYNTPDDSGVGYRVWDVSGEGYSLQDDLSSGTEALDYNPQGKGVMSTDFASLDLPKNPPVNGVIAEKYGEGDYLTLKSGNFHTGIDIEVYEKSQVRAVMDGYVAETGFKPEYGNYIILEHSMGYKTVYAHCDNILVEEGKFVFEGDVLGIIGENGQSGMAHLHFEIWKDSNTVDPMDYIKVH
ncbi:MAG TPA: M23 family metallopeptidase [Clostridiaceae bacterium]|jgi:murein DD-endopeptidase MepM/ murein hydrolase activator NlpD|nr:M23 family metallopeptidase [Clostridiaceae bacterium]